MKLEILNPNYEVENTYTSQSYIAFKLLDILAKRDLNEMENLYKKKWQANYNNLQTIKFTTDNGYTFKFIDIPMGGNQVDTATIEQIVKNEIMKGGE